MAEIIRTERKRILSMRIFFIFLLTVTLFSIYSACSVLGRYRIPGSEGTAVAWRENLNHAKTSLQGKSIDSEFLDDMRQHADAFTYLDEISLEELVAVNYDGKSVRDLSDKEIGSFYSRRLSNIRAMLEENMRIQYTQEETERFMQRAGQLSEIRFSYAEGWKVLNEDMGGFAAFLLILISVLLLPLFGTDPKSNMKELCRSAKYGKRSLDCARILTAFLSGGFLYVTGIFFYFVIKMTPFGFGGWNQCIQSSRDMFFSLYNITFLEQFLLNVMTGFIALLFAVSFLIFITVFMEKIMTSAVVYVFFWILLLLFDQMYLWPVNHYFANFMPLRMTSFSHYYIDNEIYRMFGISLSCMAWSIVLSVVIAGIMLIVAVVGIKIKRRRGMY